MKAYVVHNFDNGFLLDEERLRKVVSIIMARVKVFDQDADLIYKIYRSNSFNYSTNEIGDLLAEENADWQTINRVSLLVDSSDRVSFMLDFDNGKTNLQIEGNDRDTVFLLFSELKQYIGNEVNIIKDSLEKFMYYLPFILLIAAMIAMGAYFVSDFLSIISERPETITREAALTSNDIEAKLNYLIEKQYDRDASSRTLRSLQVTIPALLVALLATAMTLGRKQLEKLIRVFYPTYLFLFGKEIERNLKRESRREKLFWGVIVSFVVSILSGVVIWLLTRT